MLNLSPPEGVLKPSAQAPGLRRGSAIAELFTPDVLIAVSFLGDLIMILTGLSLGFWVRFRSGWITFGTETPNLNYVDYAGLFGVGTIFLLTAFGFLGVYDRRKFLRFRQVATLLVRGATFWFFAYLGLSLALKFEPPISRIYVFCSYLACLCCLLGWRWIFHRALRWNSLAQNLRQRIVFIGWNAEAERLLKVVQNEPSHPYQIMGCLDSPSGRNQSYPPGSVRRFGTHEDLPTLFAEHQIDIVILADLDAPVETIVGLTTVCEKEFVQFKVIPSYFQILVSGLQLEAISGVPILGISELPLERPLNRFVKRMIDLVGASVGLILSAPIILVCGALIYRESPGPIFYKQRRTGRNGKIFRMIKLRSMRLDAEEEGGVQWAKKDDPRRLKVGGFMRRWNLDEVPQFWNVLKGEMSLVGPRPEMTELIANFKDEVPHYNARHASKPGMTGWAQVNGLRGNTSLMERIRYDLYYLENWNLWLDFQIMVLTFLRRDNAY